MIVTRTLSPASWREPEEMLHEVRTKLGMEGKTPDQIAEGVQAAYAKG